MNLDLKLPNKVLGMARKSILVFRFSVEVALSIIYNILHNIVTTLLLLWLVKCHATKQGSKGNLMNLEVLTYLLNQ